MSGDRLLAVLLTVTLAAGCGGGADPAPTAAVDKSLPGTPAGVEKALLTASDVGEGWVDVGPTPFEERGVDACPPTNVLSADEDAERVGEAQTFFTESESRRAPTFFESISLWQSPQVAAERLRTFATAPAVCLGGTMTTPDGKEVKVTAREQVAPDLGDGAVANALSFDFADGPDSVVDLIAVRLDDVIVFSNGERFEDEPDASLDRARLLELTRRAVDKVEQDMPLS